MKLLKPFESVGDGRETSLGERWSRALRDPGLWLILASMAAWMVYVFTIGGKT